MILIEFKPINLPGMKIESYKSIFKKLTCFLFLSLIPFLLFSQSYTYPETKTESKKDEYFGITIEDSYQWLENISAEEVENWKLSQDKFLQSYLSDVKSLNLISELIDALGETGNSYSIPQKGGSLYYYDVSEPDLEHDKVYQARSLSGQRKLILDMNKELEVGYDFNTFSASPDGKSLVFSISKEESNYGELWIYDLDKKKWAEKIDGTRGANVAWTNYGGFYFIYYGESERLATKEILPIPEIRYHTLFTDSSKDITVLERPEGSNMLFRLVSGHDGKHAVISTLDGRSDRNMVYLADATNSHKLYPLVPDDKYFLNYIGSHKDNFYFFSNKNASKGKVISINKNENAESRWKTIIPEMKETLAGGSTAGGNAMNLIGEKFVLLYREGTKTMVRIFSLEGEVQHEIPLETGWIGSGLVGVPNGDEAYLSLNTFLTPSSVIRIDLDTGKLSEPFDRELPINADDYISKNSYYTSHDGTKVPIYIAHKKGLKLDGSNPVFMYAYGFGGWVATPWYQSHLLAFLELGGIYVLPGVRGGGEFGNEWKEDGILLNRQNAINDYIAAGEYLIDQGYTSSGKIVANGWSASGSLAAAAVMQRPDLYGAAVIGIPYLDMLRYEEFSSFKGWNRSYGSVEDKAEFLNLYNWSPYHNIKKGTCYPPMIVTVGEKDQTAPPQHGYKFVAAMQEHQQNCSDPTLLKIVWGEGHGFGTTSEQSLETYSQEIAFLTKVLGLDTRKLKKMSSN